jgi:hypothetical protein
LTNWKCLCQDQPMRRLVKLSVKLSTSLFKEIASMK